MLLPFFLRTLCDIQDSSTPASDFRLSSQYFLLSKQAFRGLNSLPENKGKLALFGGIKNARFRKQVTPGDVLTLHCELVEQRGPVGIGKASAYVDGKCAATAELTFVLT